MKRLSVLLLFLVSPLSRMQAAVSIYVPPESLAAVAPIVVEGRVERVASGYDPVTHGVATYVTLRVAVMHRGPAELARIVLREPGGRYGDVIHEVDAVPLFHPGEDVLVFAEPAKDGTLRTAEMFFGKYTLLDGGMTGLRGLTGRRAQREMSGRGLILRAPPEVIEELPLADLVSLVATTPLRSAADPVAPRATPPELARVLWDASSTQEAPPSAGPRSGAPGSLAAKTDGPADTVPEFAPSSTTYPARWDETDSGLAIPVDVERARNPLGDGAAALAEVARAMAAWNAVPESRVSLRVGNGDASFTSSNVRSPAQSLPSSNIVLFGDPYDDLSDPVGCAGTIAFGGYWRSSTPTKVVNGVSSYPIKRLYVIVNRSFECFLAEPRNLAEIATHELGHGIGLGHSNAPGSIMRAFAYGDRGAVLAADDRDAVHCVYPHAFTITAPNGGETWLAGTVRTISWTSSAEPGGDPGTVSVEWSQDGGVTWRPIAEGKRNDGTLPWLVPGVPGVQNRIRVSRRTLSGAPAGGFPAVCSQDASNASFTVRPVTHPAGRELPRPAYP